MPGAATESGAFTFTLSPEEHTLLLEVLEQKLHDKLIEEHRTDSITFREHVQRQGVVLQGLIDKLRRP